MSPNRCAGCPHSAQVSGQFIIVGSIDARARISRRACSTRPVLTLVDQIGLIADISEGLIRKVTTFYAFPPKQRPSDVSAATLDVIWNGLETRFHPPAVAMLCTEDVFDRWITQPEKEKTIQNAIDQGGAFIRQRTKDPPFPQFDR